MSFVSRLLGRARGDVPLVRPRRSTPAEAPHGPGEATVPFEPVQTTGPDGRESGRVQAAAADVRTEPPPPVSVRRAHPQVSGSVAVGRGDAVPGARAVEAMSRQAPPPPRRRAEPVWPAVEDAPKPVPAGRDVISDATGTRAAGAPATSRPQQDLRETAERARPLVRTVVADTRTAMRDEARERRARGGTARDAEDPVIRIHIGRIEVRAEKEQVPPQPQRRHPAMPRLTLEEYARQRARGER